jgi:hypothetical protein
VPLGRRALITLIYKNPVINPNQLPDFPSYLGEHKPASFDDVNDDKDEKIVFTSLEFKNLLMDTPEKIE